MFVAQLIRDFSSSETDLESLRDKYFYHVKKTKGDFPFGINCELKRRVSTRTGDPVVVKLARDVHTLIDVAEGGDCNLLRPLISTSKSRRPSLVARPNCVVPENTSKKDVCTCASELMLLRDQVSSLQANHLLLQQSLVASEVARKSQLKEVTTAVSDVRSFVGKCASVLSDIAVRSEETISSLTSSLTQRVTEFEDRLRLLESFLDINQIVTIASLKSDIFTADTINTGQNSDVSKYPGDNVNPQIVSCKDGGSIGAATSDAFPTDDARDIMCCNTLSAMPVSGVGRQSDDNCEYSSNNLAVGETRGRPIPVIITNRNECRTTDIDGFTVSRRRRTKHYCLRGLSNMVDIDTLASVINRKGPTVSSIRVIKSRKNNNRVILRLNVMDNDRADDVLTEGFWPDYVSCDPWRPRRHGRERRVSPRLTKLRGSVRGHVQQLDSSDHTGWINESRYRCLADLD